MLKFTRRQFMAGIATLPLMAYFPPSVAAQPNTRLRGASCIRNAEQARAIGANWWVNWTPRPGIALDGFSPQLRDLSQMGAVDTLRGAEHVRLFNEPNLSCQANMTLDQVTEAIHTVAESLPETLLGTPELYCDPTGYTHTDIVRAYESRYGSQPPYGLIVVHAYGWEHNEIIAKIDRQIKELDGLGYTTQPVWISEWGGWPNADWVECCYPTVVRRVLAAMNERPRIARECWFPTWWDPAWTDPGGTDWTVTRLLDANGQLTKLGQTYVQG